MHVVEVDERDSSWEDADPRFRVYLFTGGDLPYTSWTVETCDITGAGLLDVLGWAEERAGEQNALYAIALVGTDHRVPQVQRRGLTWLIGMDANHPAETEAERRCYAEMLARRDSPVLGCQG
ncbi:hypothetical protein [Sciscionella sediminilitoris]|uniref:hypothetical protein n=1 Tax=Sciscionella sediminilitoris TaxID=1445613 RepID=UPI0004DF6347|nr:hypothetical protein [Sciscionella sp. SE31]